MLLVRSAAVAMVLVIGLIGRAGAPDPVKDQPPAEPPVAEGEQAICPRLIDFVQDVRPILQAHCEPCHFEGGTLYEKMPFDKQETIYRLGEKLFTRINADNEQRIIRAFLAQSHPPLP